MKRLFSLRCNQTDYVTWFYGALIVINLLAALILGSQVYGISQTLRQGSAEDLHWATEQSEVDYLQTALALVHLGTDRDGSIPNLHDAILKFDVLYNSVDAIVPLARSFQDFIPAPQAFNIRLMALRSQLNQLAPKVEALALVDLAGIETIRKQLDSLAPESRLLVLRGMLASLRRDEHFYMQHVRSFQQFITLGALLSLLLLGVAAVSFLLSRTARLRLEAAERLKTTLRSSFEMALDAVIVTDAEGRIVLFNAAAEALFEKPRGDVLGESISTLWLMKTKPEKGYDLKLIGRLAGQRRRRLRLHTKSGRVVPISVSVVSGRRTSGCKLHIGFVRDISATIAVERRRRMIVRRVEQESGEKVRFLAAASHELRTPMQGVLGAIDLVLRQQPDAAVQSLLTIAQQSAIAALDQIEHVLDLTAMDDNSLVARVKEPFSSRAMAAELVAAALQSGPEQGVDIRLQIDAAVPDTCLGDPRAMRQVIGNLLNNAMKFGADRPIFLRLGMTPQSLLRIEIEDSGIGIDPADQARIFDDFEALDRGYGRLAGGTGIGLGIVRRAVQKMGGTVGVKSQLGRGSLFWVELPFDLGPVAGIPQVMLARKVLIVDDQAVNRVLLRNMLISLGHEAHEAADGESAVAMAGQLVFDLILMDISMPGMDGIEATRQIRAGNMSHQARIVGLTANLQSSDHTRARGAGVNEIMYKPIRTRDLERVLAPNAVVEEVSVQNNLRAGIADAIEVLGDSLGLTRLRSIAQEMQASIHVLLDWNLAEIDALTLAQKAHQCAGGAAIFGALPLHAALCELENAATEGDWEILPDLEENCRTALTRCFALIDAEITIFSERLPARD